MGYQMVTKHGHNFWVVASLLQKAIRRGDFKRAGYAANELFDDYSSFLWNRLFIISCEDCRAPVTREILALHEVDQMINKNKKKGEKNKIFVGKALVILLEACKGRDGDYMADCLMREMNPEMRADPAFNQDFDVLSLSSVKVDGDIFPDYVFDPHTLQGKKMGRNFKNYDFDYIEQKDMKPQCKQMSLFDGEPWTYDDMYDENGERTLPGYQYTPKPFGAGRMEAENGGPDDKKE